MIILIPHSERKLLNRESSEVSKKQKGIAKKEGVNSLFSKPELKKIAKGREIVAKEFLVEHKDLQPGSLRYLGVLYKNLALSEIEEEKKSLWLPKIYVVNPYNGISPIEEEIPYYKIKFSNKMQSESLKLFWRNILEGIETKEEVYSLLPQEHSEVVKGWKISKIILPEPKNMSNHANKATKGKFLASLIVSNDIEATLKDFKGYIN